MINNLYKNLILPQNYIAEELLLGVILIYPNIFNKIIPSLQKEYFFLESHKVMYTYLININKHKKLNIIELLYELESSKTLYVIGGLHKIINMMKQSQVFISSSNINSYIEELIKLINHKYIKRLIIQYGHNIIKLGYLSHISSQNLYSKALSYLKFTEIQVSKDETSILNVKDLVSEKLLQIKHDKTNFLRYPKQKLIKSGLLELDKITSGLPNGDLIIIAGRPSMGKTSLAINIAYNNFDNTKLSICIFSLEMSSQQILNKFISIGSEIPFNNWISKLNENQWNNITDICYKLLKSNIYINEKHNMSIDYINHTAKTLKKKIRIFN